MVHNVGGRYGVEIFFDNITFPMFLIGVKNGTTRLLSVLDNNGLFEVRVTNNMAEAARVRVSGELALPGRASPIVLPQMFVSSSRPVTFKKGRHMDQPRQLRVPYVVPLEGANRELIGDEYLSALTMTFEKESMGDGLVYALGVDRDSGIVEDESDDFVVGDTFRAEVFFGSEALARRLGLSRVI